MRKISLTLVLLVTAAAPLSFGASDPSLLADAMMKRDLAGLQALIGQEADVNAPQADGSTALHWAAYWDDLAAAELLIEAGADPGASSRLGATPLYLASVNGSAAMIERLLAAGANPNETILNNGERSLMFAARSGDVESVRVLLDAGATIDARETLRGTTALIWAAEQNHATVVTLLIERGANPNMRSGTVVPAGRGGGGAPPAPSGGLTALMMASREGGIESARALLDGGALVNRQSGEGHTALITAIQNGHIALARMLVERGADVNLSNDRGWNPLYLTVKARVPETGTMPNPVYDRGELYELAELLLARGANVNVRLTGNTEVRNAIRSTWLEEAGATPFLRASLGGDLPMMNLLLAHGADPMIPTHDGTTALMALAGVGFTEGFMVDYGGPEMSVEAMKLLIGFGYDLDAKTAGDSVTALHGAAHKNFTQGIQLLVDAGADLTVRSTRRGQFQRTEGDPIQNTVLDWAEGIQTGMESAIYNAPAVELLEKLLTERGLPHERLSGTVGGRVFVSP